MQTFIDKVKQALVVEPFDVFAAQRVMAPVGRPSKRASHLNGSARQGAVLLLLYARADKVHVVFAKRPDTLKHHAGQIAFPGGRVEPAETYAEAALRETHEEVGIPPHKITLLGQLTPIYIPPSDFEVYPFVGWHSGLPQFRPSPREVAQLLEVPLSHFFQPKNKVLDEWNFPFFRVEDYRLWGGTAVMLNEFMERLAAVDGVSAE